MVGDCHASDTDRRVRTLLAGFVALVLGAAAIAKLWNPEPGRPAFDLTVALVGRGEMSSWALWTAAIAVEMFLASLLCLRPRSRTAAALAAMLFGSFLIWVLTIGRDQRLSSCGCFGAFDVAPDPILAPVRNASLLMVTAWLALVPAQRIVERAAVARPRASRGAFTLAETLVVIALVALLAALALPAFGRARDGAVDTRALATLRDAATGVAAYAARERGSLPYTWSAPGPEGPFSVRGKTKRYGSYFRDQASCVVYAMGSDAEIEPYLVDRAYEQILAQADPFRDAPWPRPGKIWLTFNAFCPDAYVRPGKPAPGLQPAGRRIDEIARPSAKGLLLHMQRGVFHPDPSRKSADALAATADGGARRFDFDAAIDALGDGWIHRPHGYVAWPVLGAPGGLAGVDF